MGDKLNKYRIRERLERAFTFASGMPALAAVVALITVIVVAKIYAGALNDYGFAQGDVGKAMTYFAETRSALRGVIGYDEMSAIESMLASHDENVELFEQSFAELESAMVSEANKAIYNDISAKLADYWKLENEILTLGATTDRAITAQAQSRAMTELAPMFNDIYAQLTEIMDIKVERGNRISAVMTVVCVGLAVAIAIIIVISMILSIRLGRNIADGISKPMKSLGDRLEDFAKGDLFSPFPTVETKDEVSDMVEAANDMAEALDFIISDMEYTLGKMAASDYTVRSKDGSRYIGDFKQLFDSSKKLRDCMIDTLRFIGDSSVQVTAGSDNLAETSQSLAEGATEQASAVEELQATITTIAEAAEQAAANAEDAYQQSQAMVEAMARINDASKKIGNIISEIESIASQTNLLSLNASIEAARAGEAGRGFSVVADQIRQLAEQSSKSAVDTRTLIEGAMQEVENGNKVAERAVASIGIVVEGIRKVATSSKELSTVSASQAETMKEAEEGINQISDVIQTNAAVAQESSATSQELSASAASLDALIAKFELPPVKKG